MSPDLHQPDIQTPNQDIVCTTYTVCFPTRFTWIIVGVWNHKHLQRFAGPLIGFIRYVKALLPHTAVGVIKLEERVHIQHLKLNNKCRVKYDSSGLLLQREELIL